MSGFTIPHGEAVAIGMAAAGEIAMAMGLWSADAQKRQRELIAAAGLPAEAVQLVPTTDRAVVGALLRASDFVDLIVPRGGKSLVARVQEEARVPVLAHLDGINHS